MKKIILPLLVLITLHSTAQVGIGTKIPEPSAMLEVKSNTKGVLISRMTESERSSIKTPVAGLLVYQTDRSAGFYYHTGIEWKYLPPAAISQPLNSSTTANGVLASNSTATTYIFNSPLVENLGAVSLSKATSVASGYLSSADWNTFNNKLSVATGQAALNTKVTANSAIVGGTKTKITYDSKGLVTAGANATTNDIVEGTNLYFTEQRVRNTALTGYTVGTNTTVANTDNVMGSIAKLQGQINAKQTSGQVWLLGGNAGTNPSTQFVGTNDNKDLVFKVNNIESGRININANNTSFGLQSLRNNTSGFQNTAIGSMSLSQNTTGTANSSIGLNSLRTNTTGSNNNALGVSALENNVNGNANTALGSASLNKHISGDANVAIGHNSLYSDLTGYNNVAIGYNTLYSNTTGAENIGIGRGSLTSNTTGGPNVAIGTNSLGLNTTGYNNVGIGFVSMANNTTGAENIGIGRGSLTSNTTGGPNVAIGTNTLASNTIGYNNIGIGLGAVKSNTSAIDNIGIGRESLSANTIGNSNIGIGTSSLKLNTIGYNNIAIGIASMLNNSSGYYNTVIGWSALASNTIGNFNTAIGGNSMTFNVEGSDNNAFGDGSLYSNTNGNANNAIGRSSLFSNKTGSNNVAVGEAALTNSTGDNLVAIGAESGIGNTLGSNNTFLGEFSNTTNGILSNSTAIGYNSYFSTSNTVSIGNGNVAKWVFGIPTVTNDGYAFQVGSTTSNGNGAYLTNGGTWTNASSRDFKENFEDINGANLLEQIEKMKVQKWSYIGTDEVHVGPVAEEFKSLFNLGVKDDDKHISTLDASGIALKAIQQLNVDNKKLKAENTVLKNKYQSLEERVLELEQLIKSFPKSQNQ